MTSKYPNAGGGERSPDTPTSYCLTPLELALYTETGDLPMERLDHIESCRLCEEMIEAAASPPEVGDFLFNLEQEAPAQALSAPATPRNFWKAFSWAAMVGCVALIGQLMSISGKADRQATSQSARLVELESEIEEIRSELNASLVRETKNRSPMLWSDVALIAWLESDRGLTQDHWVQAIQQAEAKGFMQGISKAILMGKIRYKTGRPAVPAARKYLSQYSDEAILEWVAKHSELAGFNPKRLTRLYNENIKRFKNLNPVREESNDPKNPNGPLSEDGGKVPGGSEGAVEIDG